MSADLLGQDTFDIHGGGNENIFPHNENEIAQSEAHLGKKMANYWMLWSMVNINGEKMSKSKNNHTTIKTILANYDPMVARLWIISSHYRSIIDYTESSLAQAKTNLKKITDWVNNLQTISANAPNEKSEISFTHIYQKRFEEAMDDDLNTPIALSVIYELITETNKLLAENKLSPATAKEILSFWNRINKVLGLIIIEQEEIPENVILLADRRKQAREEKDFQLSDDLRKEIEDHGYSIEDLKSNDYLIKKL
jgi:cysteinyl-tRNA synthetase